MSRPVQLSVQDWREGLSVVDPSSKEIISGMLWHRLTYVSAATLALDFFTVNAAGVVGNLDAAGQLPAGTYQLVEAIRIAILAPTHETGLAAPAASVTETAIQDVQNIAYNGTAEFWVGSKSYGRFPIFTLPAGAGPSGQIAVTGVGTADTTTQLSYATNGIPDIRAVYSLPIPVVIPPQYNYRVELRWAVAQTLVGGNTDILVMLDGELMRSRQ